MKLQRKQKQREDWEADQKQAVTWARPELHLKKKWIKQVHDEMWCLPLKTCNIQDPVFKVISASSGMEVKGIDWYLFAFPEMPGIKVGASEQALQPGSYQVRGSMKQLKSKREH